MEDNEAIKTYLINQIQENLRWLARHTDVDWDVVTASNEPDVHGIRFRDTNRTITTIYEDEA